MKKNSGITLLALVVTIAVLIILASVAIYISLGENGIFNKSKEAKNETTKQAAVEIMNLKITNIQVASYAETNELPNLQFLADKLCEDNDIEYVLTQSKDYASLDKIDVVSSSSIFTKLKEYPFEFEINSSLQLASIDGIKVASNNIATQSAFKVFVDEAETNTFPPKGNDYIAGEISCTCGATAEWDYEKSGLAFSNLTDQNTQCEVHFYSLNYVTNKIKTNKDIEKFISYSTKNKDFLSNLLKNENILEQLLNNEQTKTLLLSNAEDCDVLDKITVTIPKLNNDTNVIYGNKFDENYTGFKAFDGNNSTRFASKSGGIQNYIGYDFGKEIMVYKISWINPNLNENIKTFKIQYYDESDRTWKDASETITSPNTENNASNSIILNRFYKASKWRLYILSSTSAAYVNVATLQFYGI